MRVLVVEDSPRLADVVAKGLRSHGMAVDIAYDGGSDTVDGQMRQLMHVVKRPYLYFRFQPSLSEGVSALDDISERNIADLKRRAELVYVDAEKSEKIDKLCALLKRRFIK